jgi:hypothetical protein
MCFYVVKEFAKSTYCGKKGKAVLFANGHDTWKRGDKYAKYICLVFKSGPFAGRPMWYSIRELYT